MKVTYWELADAARLTDFYNKEFANQTFRKSLIKTNIPYCYPVSKEEFEIGVRHHEEDKPYKELSHEKFIIGKQEGEIVGFAHVAKWHKERSGDWGIARYPLGDILHNHIGVIRFLHYRRGYRPVGQAILQRKAKG